MKADRRWYNDGRWERESEAWAEDFYERNPRAPTGNRYFEIGPNGTRLVVRLPTVVLPGYIELIKLDLGFTVN